MTGLNHIREEWQIEIACELDSLDTMDVEVAQGIRDASQLPRERYAEPVDENAMELVVIYAGTAIVIIAETPGSPDHAWSGRFEDEEILHELVDDGFLARVE